MQHQLAQCAEHKEREDAAKRVDEHENWPGGCQAAACTHEQAGTDRAANGDHLYLSGFQAFVVTLLFLGEEFLQVAFGGLW